MGADKIEFCKLYEPDLFALGERMPDRHDRDELVRPVGQDLKSRRRKIAAENADVRRILGDRANDLLACAPASFRLTLRQASTARSVSIVRRLPRW